MLAACPANLTVLDLEMFSLCDRMFIMNLKYQQQQQQQLQL
jgi:hypothetical protein